jgi:general secretion pathway protein I
LSRRMPIERDREAGFTIIEAVVALALVSILLASIGSIVATNAQSSRRLEQHVALVETARLIASGLPRAGEAFPSKMTGQVSGFAWQMRTSPFRGEIVQGSGFIPTLVELRVRSPTGAVLSLQTVRLQERSGH